MTTESAFPRGQRRVPLLLATGLGFLFLQVSVVHGRAIRYFGAGNPTGHPETLAALDALDRALAAAATSTGWGYHKNIVKGTETQHIGAQQLSAGLASAKTQVTSEDLFVFCYVGHGGTTNQTLGLEDCDGPPDCALTKGDEWIGSVGDPYFDDTLGTAFKEINARAHKLAIVDACFGGGMVGGAHDINDNDKNQLNMGFLLSAKETQEDMGRWAWGPYLETAFQKNSQKKFKGDGNEDGTVTIEEWFDYAWDARKAEHGDQVGGTKGFGYWKGQETKAVALMRDKSFQVTSGSLVLDLGDEIGSTTSELEGTFSVVFPPDGGGIGESDTFTLGDCYLTNTDMMQLALGGLATVAAQPGSIRFLDFAQSGPGHIGPGGSAQVDTDVYVEATFGLTGSTTTTFTTATWAGQLLPFDLSFTTTVTQSDTMIATLSGTFSYEIGLAGQSQTITLDLILSAEGTAHVVPDPGLGGLVALGVGAAGAWLRRSLPKS